LFAQVVAERSTLILSAAVIDIGWFPRSTEWWVKLCPLQSRGCSVATLTNLVLIPVLLGLKKARSEMKTTSPPRVPWLPKHVVSEAEQTQENCLEIPERQAKKPLHD